MLFYKDTFVRVIKLSKAYFVAVLTLSGSGISAGKLHPQNAPKPSDLMLCGRFFYYIFLL